MPGGIHRDHRSRLQWQEIRKCSPGSPIPATTRHSVRTRRDCRSRLQTSKMHKHLRRLGHVWINRPIYFITTCTAGRRTILASKEVSEILIDEWRNGHRRHGWAIGRYVIMPDHVHFFCRAELGAKPLQVFMQRWKEWSSKRMTRELNISGTVWQEEFFDHVLRSGESYSQKWGYVKENPVRAGLVTSSGEWPWQGEIELLTL